MRLFRISDVVKSEYVGTLKEAHAIAKVNYGRITVLIEEVEVPTDKDNLLRLLNGSGGYERDTLREWGLKARGGLELQADMRPGYKGELPQPAAV